MQRKYWATALPATGVAAALLLAGLASVAPAAAADEAPILSAACKPVEAMFARGSGQPLNGGEAKEFNTQMGKRFGADNILIYEVGTDKVGGKQYPAVPVAGGFEGFGNAIGGKVTSGGGNDYGKSVNQGVDELAAVLDHRTAKCPTTQFVLAGYSQGAQVIGETYVEKLTDAQRKRVAFNALFGDPKLYLPEGESRWHKEEGKFFKANYAEACKGTGFSEWRRVVPNCNTDNGSLGARKPYLPESFTSSTGLWCAEVDFVCGSRKFLWENDDHGSYKKSDGDIAAGVLEAAKRILTIRPDLAGVVDISDVKPVSGKNGLDVVFIVDSTGSMSDIIDSTKAFTKDMASRIKAQKGRVALVEYRDAGDEFTARVLSGLSEDTTAMQSKLDEIVVDGGGDTPEAALHALMTAFNGLEWRNGATKAAILLTDADYHDPDYVDGSTLAAVSKRSLEIDPVNVYPVVPADYSDFYQDLAEATTGQVVINDGDAASALETTLAKIESRPVPVLPFMDYYAAVGDTITFDTSGSYSVDSEIVRWDWDFDGDGVYEVLDGPSIESHEYKEIFDGIMQVRATDSNGLVSNISAFVHVGTATGKEGQPMPADTLIVAADGTSALLEWTALESPTGFWGITVNGIPVGKVGAADRTVTVTDLDRTVTTEVGVVPFSTQQEMGQSRVAYIDPEVVEETPAPTTPGPTPPPTVPAGPSTTPPAPTTGYPTTTEPGMVITPAATVGKTLARTGSTTAPLLVVGAGVLLAGLALVVARRRRAQH